ncbi:MAG TPA: asparaginase [Planctomycetaceae bacterium]|nr:asparaginase [Planctomycetaceae bacterium]HRF00750.1 asparaginase domain-containing protein [Pirellulaceae bacterium]
MTIRILTAGGTIDKVYFDALSEYSVGNPQIVGILASAAVEVPTAVETLFRKDSLELTDDDRATIVARVQAIAETRILITHGTDTMTRTAEALREVSGKTIVLVGSLSPACLKETDAEFNVGFAFAAVQLLPPGVWIAMNGRVFAAGQVRKNRDANRFEATD